MKKRLLAITFAFCISFVAMVALSLYSMQRFTTFASYSDQVNHSNSVIICLSKAEISLRDIDRTERGYMLTQDTMYVRFMNNAVDSINKAILQLQQMVADNEQQQKSITLLKGNVAIRIAALRDNISYVDTAKSTAPSKYYFDSRQLMIECSRMLRAIKLEENILLKERFEIKQFYQQLANRTLIFLLCVFCLVTLVLFIFMIRELRTRMIFQEELQAKVMDLKRSHSELEEIAYAASHDLQEPLRKIQVFSNMLILGNTVADEKAKETLHRINSSAGRMQVLITDLISLTNLTKIDELRSPADLGRVMEYVLIDTDEVIKEKNALVEVLPLPVIDGYYNQLKILFKALLDNSLKFTRDGVRPIINISTEIVSGDELAEVNPNLKHRRFYRITFSDNGIGFDNIFIKKIFRIFQRLHNHDAAYEGKGIGLAICQRILANHEGYILASGIPNVGAQFKLYFPLGD